MKVRKAVFPAAGWGTRFLPATKALPKEMIPLVDKPIIQYAVEEAVAAGITQIIIVTAAGKESIADHFDIALRLEHALAEKGRYDLRDELRGIADLAEIAYVRQKEQLGLGHAIGVTRAFVGDEPFAVFLSDDLIAHERPCMAQMLAVFERYGGPVVAVERVPPEQISSYGVVKPRWLDERVAAVEDLVEKPAPADAPSNLGIVGRYILTPDIFDAIATTPAGAGGEIQLTDALRQLLGQRTIYAYEFEGQRYDTGNKLGFLKATVDFGLRRPDLADEFRAYLRGLDLS
jgi:UTP--glucose-1-phosphate uridylyltransferase